MRREYYLCFCPFTWDTIRQRPADNPAERDRSLRGAPVGMAGQNQDKEAVMRRLVGIMVAAVVAVAVPMTAHAQAMKTTNASGTVSAVTAASMTVKGKNAGDMWTFMIDKDTSVVAKGATHKSLAMQADNKGTMLTDFVKVGDNVTVAYSDMGSMKHAATITVTSPPAPK